MTSSDFNAFLAVEQIETPHSRAGAWIGIACHFAAWALIGAVFAGILWGCL